jgi:stringent starvation protein B
MDKLIHAATILFALSLAVERVAEFFKRRNWTCRLFWPGNWKWVRAKRATQGWAYEVDLRTGTAVAVSLDGTRVPVEDEHERRRHIEAANAANTLFIGIALAAVSHANAFEPFGDKLWVPMGIVLTGAASSIGSSFWHDILGMLIEVRRLRRTMADVRNNPEMELAEKPLEPSQGWEAVPSDEQSQRRRQANEDARRLSQQLKQEGIAAPRVEVTQSEADPSPRLVVRGVDQPKLDSLVAQLKLRTPVEAAL